MKFTLHKTDIRSKARLGTLETAHGTIETPTFMPVGTRGAVKTLTAKHLMEIDAKIILGNTYHLMLRPGASLIEKAGGLHRFIGWDRPILTDSGGFQVFSLSKLNKITDQGVHFRSHIDGKSCFLGPVESMEIQRSLGADIVMAFDECAPYPCTKEAMEKAMERTQRWGRICRDFSLKEHQALFGITQGGVEENLRVESTKQVVEIPYDGYAIGGLSVGEPAEMMYRAIDVSEPYLPFAKPRYLMGVGTPRNLIEAVRRGIDLFDCVLPTRNARNGTAFTWAGKLSIKAGRYRDDFSPMDPMLEAYPSQFSRAYICHLLNVGEITGLTLVTLQNLAFYLDFMKQLRQAIRDGVFEDFYLKICEIYPN